MAVAKKSAFRRFIEERKWWILVAAAGGAFVMGCLGFFQFFAQQSVGPGQDVPWLAFFDPSTPGLKMRVGSAYYALQMLVLNPPFLEKPVPLLVEGGRWLAAVVFFFATYNVIFLFLRRDLQGLKILNIRKDHVVICGLGNLGIDLAMKVKESGDRLIAIEENPAKESVQEAFNQGIPVVFGNATEADTLRRAHAHQAKKVYAICTRDETNIAVAAALGHLKQEKANRWVDLIHRVRTTLRMKEQEKVETECWLFISNPQLRSSLQRHNIFPHQGPHYHVNVRGLDVNAVRARLAFADLPLEHPSLEKEGTRARLILVGFGEMGQALAKQAALLAHFPGGGCLHVLVVDDKADKQMESFRHRVPNYDNVMEIKPVTGRLESSGVHQLVKQAYTSANETGELLACAICHDGDDARNLALALEIMRSTSGKAPILVYLSTKTGFVELEPGKSHGAKDDRFQPFGMIEDIWTLGTLRDERQDRLAKAFHEAYLDSIEEKNPEDPAQEPWQQLDETYRDANRAEADHLHIKLRTIGLEMMRHKSQCCQAAINLLVKADFELLAKMEHTRWCAERWLDGWSYADIPEKDKIKKLHPALLPWDRLNEATREWNRVQFKAKMGSICDTLSRTEFGIGPLPDAGTSGSKAL